MNILREGLRASLEELRASWDGLGISLEAFEANFMSLGPSWECLRARGRVLATSERASELGVGVGWAGVGESERKWSISSMW